MPPEVCPRCGQSLYWCGESGVCEMGGVMEKFTASNGVEIVRKGDEDTYQAWNIGNANRVLFAPHEFEALREFFLHERDQELGRWRWPEDQNVVVVPDRSNFYGDGKRWASVYDERRMGRNSWYCADTSSKGVRGDQPMHDAAHDYFAAHPVSKPWHAAEPGEVWLLTFLSGEQMIGLVDHDGECFIGAGQELTVIKSTAFTAGRRIWPEVS